MLFSCQYSSNTGKYSCRVHRGRKPALVTEVVGRGRTLLSNQSGTKSQKGSGFTLSVLVSLLILLRRRWVWWRVATITSSYRRGRSIALAIARRRRRSAVAAAVTRLRRWSAVGTVLQMSAYLRPNHGHFIGLRILLGRRILLRRRCTAVSVVLLRRRVVVLVMVTLSWIVGHAVCESVVELML